ncbi:MAG: DUF3800 domain-containing protein [Candidatus Omnitrophica bacterium]|nr:DUF3800 domain-containing protein [Candidatus Omnitrophota bacterium]
MKILFLDESGDHNLNYLDPGYPVFVLAGCVISQQEHDAILSHRMQEFKKEIFGSDRIILHYVDYTRNQKGFEQMSGRSFRENFYKQLNGIIAGTDFILMSCIIDKKKHKEKYKTLAIDPYTLSLEIVVERFVKLLEKQNERGVIVAESRGQQLDNELNLAFLDLKIRGTSFLRPKNIVDRIEGFFIRKKEENVAGLQLVDSLVTPIGRKFCNRKNVYLNYDVIKSKFRKADCGKYRGYGLIILPK